MLKHPYLLCDDFDLYQCVELVFSANLHLATEAICKTLKIPKTSYDQPNTHPMGLRKPLIFTDD
jgi:hypothetical protein